MKNLKFLSTLFIGGLLFTACSNDDDAAPVVVNEEEVITTLTVTLTPEGGGTPIVFQTRDLDGDGPDAPVVTDPVVLNASVTYRGAIVLLNETENPAEDITLEVKEEDDEHQFFYTIGSGLDAVTSYVDFDGDGNPLGTEFILVTGAASAGNLTFTLRHEPAKPNTGLEDAGGETDIAAPFNVTVQ